MAYQISRLLLRVAMEDACQQAVAQELSRQLHQRYGVGIHLDNNTVDCQLADDNMRITIAGQPVEWID